MVGGSNKIYSQLVELCLVKFRDGDKASSSESGGSLYVGSKEVRQRSVCETLEQLQRLRHRPNTLRVTTACLPALQLSYCTLRWVAQ